MADWKWKPQGPSLNQTREIGYFVIKTKKRHRAELYKPSLFSTIHMLKFRCYELRNRCFDDDINDFSGLIKARTLGIRFPVSHDRCPKDPC